MRHSLLVSFLGLLALGACGVTSGGGGGRLPDGFVQGGQDLAGTGGDEDLSTDPGPLDMTAAPDIAGCGVDQDGDGVSVCQGDCDDTNPKMHPGLAEACDGLDNDCNGMTDEGFDKDNDAWTTCGGDCNDNDGMVNPGQKPKCNGKDNDCDGKVDDLVDKDGDGATLCDDCNDNDPNVNKSAMEVQGDKVDNNCNTMIDEAPAACDANLPFASADPNDYAKAMEICPDPFFLSAAFPTLADAKAHRIPLDYGLYVPKGGKNFSALSTGLAGDSGDPGFVKPQIGTAFKNTLPNPLPMGAVKCIDGGGMMQTFKDPATVNDLTEFKVTLKVPSNAKSFSYDFNFMSAEYPEFVCTQFNDKFLAVLDSKKFKGNISFDAKGNAVTINNGFFTVTKAADLAGTGYDLDDFGKPIGGGTGWLTTTAPVTPGETITLRFILFDEGDRIYDSVAVLDNFKWSLNAAMAPVTMGRDGGM